MKYILTDIDDVILSWLEGFKAFLDARGIKYPSHEPSDWGLHLWLGLEQLATRDLINEFNNSDHFGWIPMKHGAKEYLNQLHADGFKLVAISSCGIEACIQSNRKLNLERMIGPIFEDVICIPLSESKKPWLSKYPPSFWIEDKPKNAYEGRECGHTPILYTHDYNKGVTDVQHCASWKEIYDFISQH